MAELKSIVARRGSLPDSLSSRKVGRSGFYYVLNREGVVVFHPSAFLAGTSMADLPMVKDMLARGDGVGVYDQGGIKRTVFFTTLSNGYLLCLSIDADESDIVQK